MPTVNAAKRETAHTILGRRRHTKDWRTLAYIALAGLACLCLAAPGAAQIRECPGASTEVGLKILRDDVFYDSSSSSPSDISRVADRLNAKLANDADEFHLIGGTPVVIVRCADRRPRGKGDFDPGTVEQLSFRQVMLEIWGKVQAEERGGVKGYVASLEYVVIPARVNELGGKPPRSLYTSERWQRAAALPEEIQKFFSAENELGIYTHIAVGMNSLDKKKYDDAFQYLCRGQILLVKKGAQRPTSPQADLLNYVRDLTTQTFQKARQDPNYSGWMKELVTGSQAPACRAGGN